MKPKRKPSPFPDKADVMRFIRDQDGKVGKRELARAFNLGPDQRSDLRRLLRELEGDGVLERGRGQHYNRPGQIADVSVLIVSQVTSDGEIFARPAKHGSEEASPGIVVVPDSRLGGALTTGDKILARLKRIGENGFEARIIRRLSAEVPSALGILASTENELRVRPISRRTRDEFIVSASDTLGAEIGELVRVKVADKSRLGLRRAKVVERLGQKFEPKTISIITAYDHDLPMEFPDEALAEAAAAGAAPLDGRADLRALPLVTIDGADARDFDDAVWAEPDKDSDNRGGWHLVVAIADVAWYVKPGSALDRNAELRGNSVYFPDRVLPMLPEALSNGWCSLKPDEDRPCLAAHIWIGADGEIRRHRFERALMRSQARLTYQDAEKMADGGIGDDPVDSAFGSVLSPLFGAYEALARARQARGVLELDVAERQVFFAADGTIERIVPRQPLTSHRLIEEFMIAANVAAAETLEGAKLPCLYRIHDEPSKDKMDSLRQFLETIGITLPRQGIIRAKDLNHLLDKYSDRQEVRLLHEVVLRSQAQAEYNPNNIGHYGLALRRYCHFTSPIRRYADLVVHRALIAALGLNADSEKDVDESLTSIAQHISGTERRAVAAERDALSRYVASYHAHHVGAEFSARVSGVARFGLFVSLDETGADALIPVSMLPDDYYIFEPDAQALVGRHSRLSFNLGTAVRVRLSEARPETGGLVCSLLGVDGIESLRTSRRRTKPSPKKRSAKRKGRKR
jgi:ribonuclease R